MDLNNVAIGIIPAYAGSTSGTSSFSCRAWDHPRIRGEHLAALNVGAGSAGSSPHTRGALGAERHGLAGIGIIPAYAGSTYIEPLYEMKSQDHPRIRGEHFSPKLRFGSYAGSSPHTRGARPSASVLSVELRIIPAYAGSTVKLSYL